MDNVILEKMRELTLLLDTKKLSENLGLQQKVNGYIGDIENRKKENNIPFLNDRQGEILHILGGKVVKLSEDELDNIFTAIEDAEMIITDYLGIQDTEYLTSEEILELDSQLKDYLNYDKKASLAEEILDMLDSDEKQLYCYDVINMEYKCVLCDKEDFHKLNRLNLIIRNDQLVYLNSDYLFESVYHELFDESWKKIFVNRNGNFLDIRRSNIEVLDMEIDKYQQQIDEATEGLENIDSERLQAGLEMQIEEKRAEIEDLLGEVEDILGEKFEDIDFDSLLEEYSDDDLSE